MIIISLGSNVTSRWGNSDITVLEALKCLRRYGIRVVRRSRLYRTAPYGPVRQPDFINAAALISTSIPPIPLLSLFKKIETKAGRETGNRWGPRALDIDILDYNHMVTNWSIHDKQVFKYSQLRLILPHPGIASRAFVLWPLLDIVPNWHHPVSGQTVAQMLKRLHSARQGRVIEIIDGDLNA